MNRHNIKTCQVWLRDNSKKNTSSLKEIKKIMKKTGYSFLEECSFGDLDISAPKYAVKKYVENTKKNKEFVYYSKHFHGQYIINIFVKK